MLEFIRWIEFYVDDELNRVELHFQNTTPFMTSSINEICAVTYDPTIGWNLSAILLSQLNLEKKYYDEKLVMLTIKRAIENYNKNKIEQIYYKKLNGQSWWQEMQILTRKNNFDLLNCITIK